MAGTKNPLKELQTAPGVGPSLAKDFVALGFSRVADLKGCDPEKMYRDLCALRGRHIDRCVLYVFRCAVYYAGHTVHKPELLKWWNWKDREQPRSRTIYTEGHAMITSIAFTVYPVTDIARARRFYETDLGLTVARFLDVWVEYDLPGGCFAITTIAECGSPSAGAGGSIAFEVDDVDALVAQLRAKGVPIKLEPFDTPVCRVAVVLDPEGNAVMLHKVTKEWS